jgi:replication factor C large subunit
MIPLIEKYRVETFEEIKDQESAINEIKFFYENFPNRKALILNGPVGTGKTSMAIALANFHNLELFELNASDLRNRLKLDEILKPASQQQSLTKKGKLILLDEADGITGSDRGGLPELIKLMEETGFPMIITSNNIWQKKFSQLRKKCQIVNLKELKQETILEILKKVNLKEDSKISLENLEHISKKTKGDVRASLNDLQTILDLGENSFKLESEREKEEDIFSSLKTIFQKPTDKDIISVFKNSNLDLDEISLWLEENIPLVYKGSALEKAQYSLSKADIFKGRIYRQQYWRFLVYQNFLLSAGISSATKLKYEKFTKYQRPSRILKIWLSNQKNAKKKSIINKYSKFTHMSKKKANKESYLLPLIINPHSKDLDLEDKEKIYLEEKRGEILRSIR